MMLRGSRRWRAALAGAAFVLVAAVAIAVAGPAAAAPATTVSYPAWASSTRYSGLAFDACTAPSIADMESYAAGNASCRNAVLTFQIPATVRRSPAAGTPTR
jgi:hypothetical protein